MSEDRLRAAARLARRMPGYRWARRRAVPRIRQSAAARALARRIVPTEPTGLGPPVDVAAGRLLAGIGIDGLPVVLLSLVGLADGSAANGSADKIIEAVIDEVAEIQLMGAGFRPVFLLDTPAFSRARSYGYLAELLTPCTAWPGEPGDWPEYVGARLSSMTRSFGVSALITVGPHGLDEVGRGVLRSFG